MSVIQVEHTHKIHGSGLFTTQVFGWMTLGIFLTAIVATAVLIIANTSENLFALVALSALPIIIIQLILVLVLSFLWRKLNVFVSIILFTFYSLFTGVTVGIISVNYSVTSLFIAFGISAFMFLILALYGLFIKQDLSRWRAVGLFGLVGVILVSIVNLLLFFVAPNFFRAIDAVLNYVIVVVFSILIVTDTNQLKALAHEAEQTGSSYTKYAISGALMLYLDFINLFLSVLRITGRR